MEQQGQLAALQAHLEQQVSNAGTDSAPSAHLHQLQKLQQALVRRKRFAQALEVLRAVDALERQEADDLRTAARQANARALQELEDRQALEQAVLQKQLSVEAASIQAEYMAYEQQFGLQPARGSVERHQSPNRTYDKASWPTRPSSPTLHQQPSTNSAWTSSGHPTHRHGAAACLESLRRSTTQHRQRLPRISKPSQESGELLFGMKTGRRADILKRKGPHQDHGIQALCMPHPDKSTSKGLIAANWTQGKPHGSDLLIDLLDESKDGSRKLPRGRRKSRSEGGWVGKTGQEPSSLKIQAGPLGMHLVEAMLGPASHKGDLTQSSNGFKLGASSFDHSRPGVQEPDNLDARDLEVLNFFQEASELWSDQHAWFPGSPEVMSPQQPASPTPAAHLPEGKAPIPAGGLPHVWQACLADSPPGTVLKQTPVSFQGGLEKAKLGLAGLNGPAQPDQGVRQDPAWTIPAKIIPPQDAGPEQAMQSRSTSTQDQPPHSQDQQRAAKGAAPNIIMGDMTMAAREDVLQMLAARLHDDPAAVLELLEQTTAALLKRQAEPGTPKQPAPYASQAKQLTADDDSISARSIINGRLSQRPATSDAVVVRSSWKGWPSPESLKAPGRPKTSRGRQDLTDPLPALQDKPESKAPVSAVEALAVISPDSNSGEATPTSSLTFRATTLPSTTISNSATQVPNSINEPAVPQATAADLVMRKDTKRNMQHCANTDNQGKPLQSSQDLTGFESPRSQKQTQVQALPVTATAKPRKSSTADVEGGRFAKHMRKSSELLRDTAADVRSKRQQQTRLSAATASSKSQVKASPKSLPARSSTASKSAAISMEASPASPRADVSRASGLVPIRRTLSNKHDTSSMPPQPPAQSPGNNLPFTHAGPKPQADTSSPGPACADDLTAEVHGQGRPAVQNTSKAEIRHIGHDQQEAALQADISSKSAALAAGRLATKAANSKQQQSSAAFVGDEEATSRPKRNLSQESVYVLRGSKTQDNNRNIKLGAGTLSAQTPSTVAVGMDTSMLPQSGSRAAGPIEAAMPMDDRSTGAQLKLQPSFGSESADILNAALRTDAAAQPGKTGLPSFGSESSDALNAAVRSERTSDGRRYSQHATSSQNSQNGLDRMDLSVRSARSLGLSRTGSAAWLERGIPLLDNSRESSRIYSKTNGSRDQGNRASSGMGEASPEERRQKSLDAPRTSSYSGMSRPPSQLGQMQAPAKAVRTASLKRVLSMSGLRGIRRWVSYPGYLTQSSFNGASRKPRNTSDAVPASSKNGGLLPALATALRPDHWLPGRDSAPAPEASSSAARGQDGPVSSSSLAEGRPQTQTPAFAVPATSPSDGGEPPINPTLLEIARAMQASGPSKHESDDSSTRMLPQQLLPPSREVMSRERSSSLQAWQLTASVQQTQFQESNCEPAAEAPPGLASSSPAEPAQPAAHDPDTAAVGMGAVTADTCASEVTPGISHQADGRHVQREPGMQLLAHDESASMPTVTPSAAPSLQRSISLHANPKDSQTRWATPMFPTLGSMTESQAESLHAPDLDSNPSGSFTSAQKGADMGAQTSTNQQGNALFNKTVQAPATGMQADQAYSPVTEKAQPVNQRARRVSFAYSRPAAMPADMSPSYPLTNSLSNPGDQCEAPEEPEALSSGAVTEPQNLAQEADVAIAEQLSQPAADEFEMLVAHSQAPLRDEDDWQSLVVEGQSTIAAQGQDPSQQPSEVEQDVAAEQSDDVRLLSQQAAGYTSCQSGQAALSEEQELARKEAPADATHEHHVTFAADQPEAESSPQPSSMTVMPNTLDIQDQSSISPLSLDQALLSQCLNGSYYEARDSLKAGASVHTVDADGNTAVALACAAGHGRIIKMLMRKGADLNTANLQGNTPLHLAAANGRKAVVKFLISNRADKDACNSEGALYTDLAVTAAHDMPNADVEEI
ncbi:hypothetical protein WJX74_000780 [Apatococcus lobatus]|uniref:Uncharacterized protein n=1 Tax=Apatococcus lobatus TaxID=904363 RepID=A0AAW1RBF0_9CHLO